MLKRRNTKLLLFILFIESVKTLKTKRAVELFAISIHDRLGKIRSKRSPIFWTEMRRGGILAFSWKFGGGTCTRLTSDKIMLREQINCRIGRTKAIDILMGNRSSMRICAT